MRVLVTGARGMLGGGRRAGARRRGDDVTVLQRGPSGLPVREVLADLGDPDAPLDAALAGQDAVVHLAAKVDVVGPWPEYARTNVDGTRRAARRRRAAGVARFVHVSSPSVAHAGDALVGAGAGPADPGGARGHYARSKALAEQLALAADEPRRSPSSPSARTWCGGPGTRSSSAGSSTGPGPGRLAVVGSGTALVDTTYVDNAVDALVAALDRAPELHGRACVVSDGEPRPVAELLASICAAAGAPAPPSRRAAPGSPGSRVPSVGDAVCAATTRR